MNYKGRYEITEDNSQEKVADEITSRLQKPKKDQIAGVLSIIGNKKAIELLMVTVEVEQNGGILKMNGSKSKEHSSGQGKATGSGSLSHRMFRRSHLIQLSPLE